MASVSPYPSSVLFGDMNRDGVSYAHPSLGSCSNSAEPDANFPYHGRYQYVDMHGLEYHPEIEEAWKRSPMSHQRDSFSEVPWWAFGAQEEEQQKGQAVDELVRNAESEDSVHSAEARMRHETGACNPCILYYYGLCTNGDSCAYCHMKHSRKQCKRIRLSRPTRDRLRNLRQMQRLPAEDAAVVAAVDG